MLPNPLHPAVVHFPIVLMFLLPISAGVALWAIRRGVKPMMAWAVPAAFAVALSLSSWVALQTGQEQGEAVEDVVSERVVEGHEEAAELFLVLTGGLVLISGLGFLRGKAGNVSRAATVVAAVAITFAGYRVGHSGGELVYKHGAANAIAQAGTGAAAGSAWKTEKGETDEKGEKDASRR
jgi:uncharacterized membrane protein